MIYPDFSPSPVLFLLTAIGFGLYAVYWIAVGFFQAVRQDIERRRRWDAFLRGLIERSGIQIEEGEILLVRLRADGRHQVSALRPKTPTPSADQPPTPGLDSPA